MTFKRNTLASLVLIASGLSLSAQAADSFNINVTGVISPAACQANITGGETIDYGTIPANTLSADEEVVLEKKSTGFTITCDAPAKLGFRVIDNRAGSSYTPTKGFSVLGTMVSPVANPLSGLGSDISGNKIGGWFNELTSITTDTSTAVSTIMSRDSGANWNNSPKLNLVPSISESDLLYSVAKSGELTPVAFSTLNASLSVQAVIAPASTLDLSQPVTLDGSVTVEMVYL